MTSSGFERKGERDRLDQDQAEKESVLYQKIGQLEVELDWLKKNLRNGKAERRAMIELGHPKIPVKRQCELLGVSRSSA